MESSEHAQRLDGGLGCLLCRGLSVLYEWGQERNGGQRQDGGRAPNGAPHCMSPRHGGRCALPFPLWCTWKAHPEGNGVAGWRDAGPGGRRPDCPLQETGTPGRWALTQQGSLSPAPARSDASLHSGASADRAVLSPVTRASALARLPLRSQRPGRLQASDTHRGSLHGDP